MCLSPLVEQEEEEEGKEETKKKVKIVRHESEEEKEKEEEHEVCEKCSEIIVKFSHLQINNGERRRKRRKRNVKSVERK